MTAERPTGPEPITATTSPGCNPSVLHADLEAGRQDVREQDALGVGHAFGDLVHRVLGEGDPNVFGLGPIDHVAEDPPDPGHALRVETVAVEALTTVRAFPTRTDARDDDPVADGQLGDSFAHLGDHADPLVAQDAADFHLGDVTLENVEVGAADGRGDHLHDHVGRLLDLRIGHFLPGLLARTLVDQCLHDGPPAVGSPSGALRLVRPVST